MDMQVDENLMEMSAGGRWSIGTVCGIAGNFLQFNGSKLLVHKWQQSILHRVYGVVRQSVKGCKKWTNACTQPD